MTSADSSQPTTDHPKHGDVWRDCRGRGFSVMHVCGHHNPPHVTGYWWPPGGESLDHTMHASIPLPSFVAGFILVERDFE